MTPSFDGRMDSGELARVLVDFLREEYESAGFDTAVIGLSGGIDSAVVCTLAAHAFGPENVHAVLMPAASSSPASLSDALLVAESTGVQSRIVGIGPMADAFLATAPDADRVRRGNVFARCRMIVLYDVSAEVGGLVLGTSNKTEILLGYGTLFGDLASAVNPLGNLYKTQVRALAEHLGIPERIRTKAPSADLWEGQEDEDELGGSYEEYDRLLYDLVERKIPPEEMIARGTNAEFLRATTERIRRYRYKGRLPRIARVEQVAPNSPPAASPDKE